MMVVSSHNRIDKNLFGADTGTIRDEHRVSRGVGVIHHPRAIGGPRHFNRPVNQERPRRSAHHRHDPHAADRRAAEPDFRSVAGETDISHRSQSRHVALRESGSRSGPNPPVSATHRAGHRDRKEMWRICRPAIASPAASSPSKFVNRVNVALDNGLSGAGLRRLTPHPARADASATRMIAAHRLHRECAETTAGRPTAIAGAFPPSNASSSSARASAISRRRRFGSFSRPRCRRRATIGGVVAGSAAQSGSRSQDRRDRVRHRLAWKRHTAGQHFVQHTAECPDVGALVDRLPSRLLRTHVGRRAEDGPFLRAARRSPSAIATSPVAAFARPKSSTFTTPSGVTLMFAGLRSR